MPLLPGETLHKRYRIVHLLAENSRGATYRARDLVAKQDVALKEILDSSPTTQRRFRDEARRLSKFAHPQLPQVLDHFSLAGVGQYLVSEYVDGIDLQTLLAGYGRFPTDLIVQWLQAACQPLTYLHAQGAAHLDVRPANLRLTPAGDIFLVNMRLAGLEGQPPQSSYSAPEANADALTDIYGLGATLYALLTGSAPPLALSRESGLDELKSAREVNPDAEPYLSLVAGRAMSLRPDTRFETVSDFARALERPSGRPELETAATPRRTPTAAPVAPFAPPPPQDRSGRWARRRQRRIEPRTAWGILGIVSLLLLGLAIVVRFSGQDDAPEPETAAAATATYVSAIVEAATALAPSPTPLPAPTNPPTPTPEPFITEIGSRMIYMPGGVFRMGRDDGEPDEGPSHLVRMDPFFIDETEVTNAAYALCVEAGVCTPPARRTATYHPAYYGDPAYDDYPVIFVNWYDAETFCEWRNARLPSEAEWEMAAGFDPEQAIMLRYPWGDAFDGVKLNYCDANCSLAQRDGAYDDGHQDTALVGSYPDGRSPIGVYEMSGNVMEWVNDWYDPRHYENSTDINPLGPVEGEFKAIRGGSWLSPAEDTAVYVRSSFDPTVARANLGFRCAMNGN